MIHIVKDDLTGPEIAALLSEHLAAMHANSPPGSVHALDLDALRGPDITFWSAWEGADLVGCGALKQIDETHGEIKSMRTATAHLRKGVAAHLLERIVKTARDRGYRRLSLETGSGEAFEAAHRLYERYGFVPTLPFAGYTDDPFSRFFTLILNPA